MTVDNARGHRRTRMAGGVLVAVLALTGCVSTPSPDDSDDPDAPGAPAAVVRVDQVGYGIGEDKRAYVMGDPGDLDGASFRVLADDGAAAVTGELGADSGPWNDTYGAVRAIDLTDLDEPGTYSIEVTGGGVDVDSPPFVIAPTSELAQPLADLTVRFFQAQRDGAEVVPDVLDRKPSHLLDEEATVYETPTYADEGVTLVDAALTPARDGTVDVSGGWFDAGDFLKFTGTTAYATAQMLLSLRSDASTPALAEEAEVGLAWLERMWDEDTRTLFLQVGIGNGNESIRTDHDVWRLPESDDLSAAEPGDPDYTISHRPVFAANEPGGPLPPSVAGRVAAAFALDAQRAASAGDTERARTRLATAAEIYAQIDTAPEGAAALATAIPAEFYPEDSWQDDLEFAATELATAAAALDDPRAETWQGEAADWAARYIDSDALGSLGVADVSALAHADLVALGDGATPALLADLRRQLVAGVDHAAADPFGAGASTLDFDSVPFTFGLIATAALYETASGDDAYRGFASQQRAWLLGANAWGSSFLIGAGSTYPRCPEHQVANLTDTDDELLGAVVNGPNEASKLDELNRFETMRPCAADGTDGVPFSVFDGQGSRYLDDVGAWQTVEPSLDFTATALLALTATAGLTQE
jgi:endoglucanase